MAGWITLNEKLLQKFAVEYTPGEFSLIADKVLTRVPVSQYSGTYLEWASYPARIYDDEVGDRTPAPEVGDSRTVTQKEFAVKPHRLRVVITKRDAETAADITDLASERIKHLKTSFLLKKEKTMVDLLSATSNSDTPSPKWDANGAKIENDIREAIAAFKENANVEPNTLIIPKPVWDKVVMDSTLREIWTLIPGRKDQNLSLESLFGMLFPNFKQVLIPEAKAVTTLGGSPEDLWDDTVYFTYSVPRGSTATFTALALFQKQDITIRTFSLDDPIAQVIVSEAEYSIATICSSAIYALTKVLT